MESQKAINKLKGGDWLHQLWAPMMKKVTAGCVKGVSVFQSCETPLTSPSLWRPVMHNSDVSQ